MTDYLQYGAMGMLMAVMVGVYQLLRMFLTGFLASFKDLVTSVKEIVPVLQDVKTTNENIVQEIRSNRGHI